MTLSIQEALTQTVSQSAAKRVFLACSGGLDSQVLLHTYASLLDALPPVSVCFVDYGSSHAKPASEAVLSVCEAHGISFLSHHVQRDAPLGDNQEAYWRQSRYDWFESLLEPTDVLMTAHHQSDQAETVLLQLCRGAGIKGLSAMLSHRALGQGMCWRPLLQVPHKQLVEYANKHAVSYVDDPSNADQSYSRNVIRHSIMPLLKTRWTEVESTISRSASHCEEASELLAELAILDTGVQGNIAFGEPLACDKLDVLSKARQRLAIRHWMACQGVRMPTAVQLEALLLQLKAGPDKHPCVMLGDCDMHRRKKHWYLKRRQS